MFASGGGDFHLHVGKFVDEGLCVCHGSADDQSAAFEEEAEAHHEVALGDRGVVAGDGFAVAAGDVDGRDVGVDAAEAEEVDDGPADSGAIDGEFDFAAPLDGLDDVRDALDDGGVAGPEGEVFEVTHGERDLFAVGEMDGVPVALGNGAFDEHQCGGVLRLA